MSSKRWIAPPSMPTMVSPALSPPASAALPAWILPICGGVKGWPTVANSSASATTVKTKLASGALRQALVMERHRLLGLGHRLEPFGRPHRRRVGVAEHLDVAAERDRAHFPAGADPVGPAEQLRPEADREGLDPDLVPARHQVMAQFVDEDEHRQDDEERHHIAEATSQKTHENPAPTRTIGV